MSAVASGRTRCVHSGALSEPSPPRPDEVEVALIGPSYGESILVHLGDGDWMIVDSCCDADGRPLALQYLDELGANPADAVKLIVASHWHDDHIRGMARLVDVCTSAQLCCAGALGSREFLSAAGGLAGRDFSEVGYGVREIHSVFSCLNGKRSSPIWAAPDRRVLRNGSSEVWSLSPGDDLFELFIRSVEGWVPSEGKTAKRNPSPSPNRLSVALWVKCGDATMLLGGDLERAGWMTVLGDRTRPTGRASVFKVPHHGSRNADAPEVWEQMLDPEPLAVLTPWRRGGRLLPAAHDVERILSRTPRAYASAKPGSSTRRRPGTVSRTLRGTGIKLTDVIGAPGLVRLRRSMATGSPWTVKLFDPACPLSDLAA